jgi:hypothetical protein
MSRTLFNPTKAAFAWRVAALSRPKTAFGASNAPKGRQCAAAARIFGGLKLTNSPERVVAE